MTTDDFDYGNAWHALMGWLEASAKDGRRVTMDDLADGYTAATAIGAVGWRRDAA